MIGVQKLTLLRNDSFPQTSWELVILMQAAQEENYEGPNNDVLQKVLREASSPNLFEIRAGEYEGKMYSDLKVIVCEVTGSQIRSPRLPAEAKVLVFIPCESVILHS